MNIKLSVVVITLNEADNIDECLKAAWKVADEIIVVDSYSTDNTKAICLNRGVKFFENEFEGHIQQKNYAASLATYDHILSLDADEVVSEELATNILSIKQSWDKDAYYLFRRSHYCGKFINYGDWYPDRKIRLFKKDAGVWAGINPHDTYILTDGKFLGKVKGDLYHYTFNSVEEHIEQANKFSSIGAKELIKRRTRVSIFSLFLHPFWRFFRSYFLRLGFLDGLRGYSIAWIIGTETYLKYLKVLWPVDKHPFNDYRVLQISSQKDWRGGEQQVAYLITELRKRGKESFMVVARNSKLQEFCEANGFQYAAFNFGNGFNLFAARKLKKICARYQIDIIHMQCSPSHTLAVFSNLMGNDAAMVLSRRVAFPIKNNLFSIKKYNYAPINKILCVSNKIKEVITPVIRHTEKIEIVYDGIDIQKFSTSSSNILKKEYDISEDTILIGNVAAIANSKDYITFVKTAELVLKSGLNTKFLIIGDDGGEERHIRELVKIKHLEDDIIFTGFRTDIQKIVPELDVFLFTSKEEGLGTAVLDAMASRVPIVATKAGGIPEMIESEYNGILCSIQNPQQLAEAVQKVVKNSQFRQTIIENASATVLNFTKEKTALKTLACYNQIIDS